MLTVRGIYENGKITITKDAAQTIPASAELIITFTDPGRIDSSTYEGVPTDVIADDPVLEDFEAEIEPESTLEDDFSIEDAASTETTTEEIDLSDSGSGKTDDYYESLREFERVPATGTITIIEGDKTKTYQLFDYSQGGLCFIADKTYEVSSHINAGITDPSSPDMVLMELEMEVRGVFKAEEGMKIGCMFLNPVDEDLWHGLLQFLG